MLQPIKLVECPRDAMQGLPHFVPTALKIRYLNALLRVGFDTLDFGSFVSPKAIPQMRDTAEVLEQLEWNVTPTKLLAIVANLRGAEQAVQYPPISYLGFPLSISETFQQRNTNKSIAQALVEIAQIQNVCLQYGKALVVYLSMGFGNPYGDPYSPEVVGEYVEKLVAMGIRTVAPSDTVGSSTPESIHALFAQLLTAFPDIEFGAHLHSTPEAVREKIEAAYRAGCRRFDGALRGFGGCPMAKDELTGNLPTEQIIHVLQDHREKVVLNEAALAQALQLSMEVFTE